MSSQSFSVAEYFLTFIDDKTRYVRVYVLKHKDQVFSCVIERKSMVETRKINRSAVEKPADRQWRRIYIQRV